MNKENINKEMAKTKAKRKENRNIFSFRYGKDGRRRSNETPYKNKNGEFSKMRSIMQKLDNQLAAEAKTKKTK